MTRSEHMAWCKKRALEYCNLGDEKNALASMFSDLRKHPETEGHIAIELGLKLIVMGHLKRPHEVRIFIEGFN